MVSPRVAEVIARADAEQSMMRRSRRSSNLQRMQRRQGQKPSWPQRFMLLLACCALWAVRVALDQPAARDWVIEVVPSFSAPAATQLEEAKEGHPGARLDLYNHTPVIPSSWTNSTLVDQPEDVMDASLRSSYRPSIFDSMLEVMTSGGAEQMLDLGDHAPPVQIPTVKPFLNITPVNATATDAVAAEYRPTIFDSALTWWNESSAAAEPLLDLRNHTPVAGAVATEYRPTIFDSALAWWNESSATADPLLDLRNHTPVAGGLHSEVAAFHNATETSACVETPCGP